MTRTPTRWQKLLAPLVRPGWAPLRRVGVLVLLCVLASAAVIVWDGVHDELGRADLAVVFGNRVERDGTPSIRLRARLDRAIELYRQGWCRFILLSGALGREGHNEAVVMQRYLLDHGIPDEHIFVDPEGINTYHTARHTAHLMREQGFQGVIAVSQYFHMSRARLALSRFGIEPVYTAHAAIIHWRDGYSILREVIAWYYYALRPYSTQAAAP
jgi:vancomycin permeability regulator SanA